MGSVLRLWLKPALMLKLRIFPLTQNVARTPTGFFFSKGYQINHFKFLEIFRRPEEKYIKIHISEPQMKE